MKLSPSRPISLISPASLTYGPINFINPLQLQQHMEIQKIPDFIPGIVDAVLAIIKDQFVGKISDEDLRILVTDSLVAISGTAHVLADANPDDGEQLRKLWLAFVNVSAANFVEQEVAQAIDKIGNEDVRVPLQTLRVPVIQMIRLVTDDIKPDDEQLEALWKEFVKNPKTQDVFFGIIDTLILENVKNESVRAILLGVWGIVKAVLRGKLGELSQ